MTMTGPYCTFLGVQQAYWRIIWMGKKVFMLKTSYTDFSGGGESPIIYPRLCRTFQVILLSATMPADVLEVTKKFMRNPVRILVKKEQLTLEGIKQFYIGVEKEVSRDYD